MKGTNLTKRPTYKLLGQSDTISFFHMQMPHWLFCDTKYTSLSLESKVAYTFLLNRFQLSKMNCWITPARTAKYEEIFVSGDDGVVLELKDNTQTKSDD